MRLINAVMIFLINYGFERIEAIIATNILNIETVFGLLIAALFYAEIPSAKEAVGGILIVASTIYMNNISTRST